ncbi:MAG: divalent cation tolerance protein CutA [Luteimonas sp.]
MRASSFSRRRDAASVRRRVSVAAGAYRHRGGSGRYCFTPDTAAAAYIARGLVEARLAACVNLLPDARRCIAGRTKAVDDVVLLLIKPMRERLPALRDRLSQCIPVTARNWSRWP